MRSLIASAATCTLLAACGPPPAPDACRARVAGDVVLTELMIDPDGSDTGNEWIELYNPSSAPLELKGLTLARSGTSTKTHTLRAGTISPRGYFTVGDVRSGPNPEWVNYSYASDFDTLPNTTGATLSLRCGTLVLDEVQYTKAPRPARSRALSGGGAEPSATANDDEAAWCDTLAALTFGGTANSGTPGAENPACAGGDAGVDGRVDGGADSSTCLDTDGGTRATVRPVPGDLVLTEFMADPSAVADTQGEWLEVLVTSQVDVNGLVIGNESSSSIVVNSASCVTATSGTRLVFARSGDPAANGGLPPLAGTFAFGLANSGARAIVLASQGVELDRLAYSAATTGASTQLDASKSTAADNDVAANLCATPAANRYGGDADAGTQGDRGTPGAPNVACP